MQILDQGHELGFRRGISGRQIGQCQPYAVGGHHFRDPECDRAFVGNARNQGRFSF